MIGPVDSNPFFDNKSFLLFNIFKTYVFLSIIGGLDTGLLISKLSTSSMITESSSLSFGTNKLGVSFSDSCELSCSYGSKRLYGSWGSWTFYGIIWWVTSKSLTYRSSMIWMSSILSIVSIFLPICLGEELNSYNGAESKNWTLSSSFSKNSTLSSGSIGKFSTSSWKLSSSSG